MAVYVSPAGNHEVWAACPEGYVTPEVWRNAHPPEIVAPAMRTVRVISKYKLWEASHERTVTLNGETVNVWTTLKSMIDAAGLTDAFAVINEIREDNPRYVAALPDIEALFGAELVSEVLAASVERTIVEVL